MEMETTKTQETRPIELKIEEWEKYNIPSMIEGGLVPGEEMSPDMSPEEKYKVIHPLAKLEQILRERSL